MTLGRARFFAAITVALPAAPAFAHAFGQRYDLPLPLWMFLTGAATAVVVSFVVAALLRHRVEPGTYPRFNILRDPGGRSMLRSLVINIVRGLGVVVFLLTVLSGFIGDQNPTNNFSPIMFWIIAWVGLAFICSLIGNLWALANPWNTIFVCAEAIFRRAYPQQQLCRYTPYPDAWGTWPAFIFFFIFAWMELVWPGASAPRNVAYVLTCYAILTWYGMYQFGRDEWLRHGEAFTVIYDLFARFAMTEVQGRENDVAWNLRPPAVGLRVGLDERPSFSLTFFALLLLATVTYDGFTETQVSKDTHHLVAGWLGDASAGIVDTLGLICFALLFMQVYSFFMMLVGYAGRCSTSMEELSPQFILSLIPIAIAYHLAHYLSLLFVFQYDPYLQKAI